MNINDYYQAIGDLHDATAEATVTVAAAEQARLARTAELAALRDTAREWVYPEDEWLRDVQHDARGVFAWAAPNRPVPETVPVPHPPPRTWDELNATAYQLHQQTAAGIDTLSGAATRYRRAKRGTVASKTSLWVGATAATVLLLCAGWTIIWMPVVGAAILTRRGIDPARRQLWTVLYVSAVIVLWFMSVFLLVTTYDYFLFTLVIPLGLGAGVAALTYTQTAGTGTQPDGADIPPPIGQHHPGTPTPPGQPGPPGSQFTDPRMATVREWGLPGASLDASGQFAGTAAKVGAKGETATAHLMRDATRHLPDLWVFHDLNLPNYPGPNMDHAAARGPYLWLIDTKYWKPGDYHKTGDTWTRDGQPFPAGESRTLNLAADKWRQVLPPDVTIYLITAVHPAGPNPIRLTNHNPQETVAYITADQLSRYLHHPSGTMPPHPAVLNSLYANTIWREPTPEHLP